MSAREGRGRGNTYGEKWHSSKLWDSVKKSKREGCQHNKIAYKADGKECKECGVKL